MTADKPSLFVPKLRFPEFRDAPDWEEVSLGTLLVRAPDYGVNAAAVPFSETLPTYIRITDINDDGQFASRARVSVDIDATDEQYLEDGDIVLARTGASVGKSYRYREEDGRLVYAGFLIRVRPNPQRLLSHFLAAYLSTWSYWDWVRLTSARSGQPGINATEYASIPLPLPPDRRTVAEQQKIADCLDSLDDLIAAEGRKLEALRQHKQGLLQQLFPRPGETVPQLRFPEFADAPHWQTSTFGERCESFSGSTPDTSNRAYYGGTIPFIRSAEIGRDETEIFLTEEGLANSAAKMVKRGDLLIALYGANSGDTALARIDGAINQAIMCLRSHDSAPYLCHYLTARKNWIIATYLQGGQGNLSGKIVLSVPLSVPHRDEQEKVADCVSTLDARIEGQAQRIDALRRHRQGLLQRLFPSPEGP